MGKQTPISKTFTLAGQEITLETGKLAALADGSVVVRQGNTMLLATAVSNPEAKEGQPFFPLSVDFREKFAAAGRIPGNFFKREGRPSDYEVLISRLVDRVIRPLFPDGYMNETQIIITLLSGDKETLPDGLAAFSASAALMVSDIPFQGPISEVRVARINGEFQVNPTRTELLDADIQLLVGANANDIMMVEGEAKECSEKELVDAIKVAHEAIKEMCQVQIDFRAQAGVTEIREVIEAASNEELKQEIDDMARAKVHEVASAGTSKMERKTKFKEIDDSIKEALLENHGEEFMEENGGLVSEYLYKVQKDTIREMVMNDRIRLDGRKTDQIRDIWCEIDYLPAAHGSSVFTRGETQSLTTVTIGTKLDEAMVDTAMDQHFEKFYLHYNFPPFCTNEAKFLRGTSRREIGHGNLARRSLEQVLPEELDFTVRVVSDILESNGSSSMATVCAGSLALMDAGIKLKAPVSGIAMGMISSEDGRYAILSDILGDEDHLGDMDFKVTGTEKGICACQMDIKIDGLPYERLEEALTQANAGRNHILGIMNSTIEASREDFKPHAPRLVRFKIDPTFIGAIIGPGGKIIQAMQKETNTVITIEEDDTHGIVTISAVSKEDLDAAKGKIMAIAAVPEVGDEYDAKVVKIMPYGAFIEFMPGKQGLLHVSEISWSRIDDVSTVLSEGDTVKVKLVGVDDRTGKFRLSRKVLMPKPEKS